MGNHKNRFYEFGEFRLDAHRRVLLKDGEPVHLTSKVFEVLLALIENSGRLLDKEELMKRVWEGTIVEEANLKNSISTLRKALSDERGASHYIQTLPKRGYKFIAPVIAFPDEDETYLIEKRTTTEIVIDASSEDQEIPAVDGNRLPLKAGLQDWLPADEDGQGDARSGITKRARTSEKPAPQLLTGKVNFLGQVTRHPLAVAVGAGVLLIATTAIAIGLYRWINASKVIPSFVFEKMKVNRISNVGNGMAVISPDGKYIAYIQYGTPNDGLWVRQAATDSAVKLLSSIGQAWGLSFSRDSNYVYYNFGDEEHREGALYKIPVLGGPPKLVMERLAGGVSFSPDGKQMVFKRTNKEVGKMELVTANADGGDERVILLANSGCRIRLFDWSPDGKRIAVSWVNDAADGQSAWQMVEIPAEGGEVTPITPPQKEPILALTWLPDGSGLILTANDRDTGLPQLWHLSYPGGQARRITNDSGPYFGATITADGETILAQRYTVSNNLWMAETGDPDRLHKVTADGAGYDDLSWTPDGRILHSEGDIGKSNLWVMNADGTGHERLTEGRDWNRWPLMSSDGRFIVYSSRRSGQRQIWRMDGDGRNAKQLTNAPEGCSQPKITPDNRFVLYRTERPLQGWTLMKIPADGGEPVKLADKAGDFVISPDGKQVAYESFDEQKRRFVIAVKPLDGGEPIKVLDYPDFPIERIERWAKDGLLCIGIPGLQIILIPVDGQRPRPLSDFKTGERIYSFTWSADGRRLALSLGAATAETLKITDFKTR